MDNSAPEVTGQSGILTTALGCDKDTTKLIRSDHNR